MHHTTISKNVTLSAHNVVVLRNFYERALGWKPESGSTPSSVSYDLGGTLVTLTQRLDTRAEKVTKTIGTLRISTREVVDSILASAETAGATLCRSPEERDFSDPGYSGQFADPEGNRWDVEWDEGMSFSASVQYVLGGT
jgi:predicted enzyme related to lactoylglutathione lyase